MQLNKGLILIIFLLSSISANSQLHIRVIQVPDNTPENASIYIAGDFQSWNPGSDNYKLNKLANGDYIIDLNPQVGTLTFKFTRGSWDTVEGNENGGFRPDRTFSYDGGPDSLLIEILSWEDTGGSQSTAAENVHILSTDYFMPQLNRNRRIWVYLPPDYDSSSKKYPVLYMHDGQNLFDSATSFSGEWEVDETLNAQHANGDHGIIVIGIDNGGSERLNEYSPWTNPQYGGGLGDEYIEFIVHTLKPDIDAQYRTMPDKANTGIMGSSMGGLISLYAGLEYPEVFGKIGSFSPAYWFSTETFQHAADNDFPQDTRLYTIVGEGEGNVYISTIQNMQTILTSSGATENNAHLIIHPDGAHSEWYWAREFNDAYEWLFKGSTTTTESVDINPKLAVYPNPFTDTITIKGLNMYERYDIEVVNTAGKIVHRSTTQNIQMNLGHLSNGKYTIHFKDHGQLIKSLPLIKL
ncbi:MAG: T9SS type A sorting domain-containing protein [Saprospiraceae bacterium]|nr:T9SS type A sorting domain-containing protein [Saprospiraceae bacterium]